MNTGLTFEAECSKALTDEGWLVSYTPVTGDQGADLIAVSGETTIAVQCKDLGRPVGNKAVQEAYSACSYYNTDFPVVISNSAFTPSARTLAAKNDVILLQRRQIKALKYLVGADDNEISKAHAGAMDHSLEQDQIEIFVENDYRGELFFFAECAIYNLELSPPVAARLFLDGLDNETGLGSGNIDIGSLIWLLKAADTWLMSEVILSEKTIEFLRASEQPSVRSLEFSDEEVLVWQTLGSQARPIQEALLSYLNDRDVRLFAAVIDMDLLKQFSFISLKT